MWTSRQCRQPSPGPSRYRVASSWSGGWSRRRACTCWSRHCARCHPTASWSLDVVGDGPWRARLEAGAEGLPVRFLGSRDHGSTLAALAAASVVAVPSVTAASGDRDGLPVVLLEAMAAGRAVVASDLPGIADVVVDGSTGLLVSPGDVTALATALARLLDDASLRGRLGSAAAVAAAELDIAAAATQYAAVLDAAAGTRSG